jgi:hypothetical protein
MGMPMMVRQVRLELAAYVEQVRHAPGTDAGLREPAARAGEEYRGLARRFVGLQD